MESEIKCKEIVVNKDAKFGSALFYYPCVVENETGERAGALFTEAELNNALERAERNPEDIEEQVTMWDHFFKGKNATLKAEIRVDHEQNENIDMADIPERNIKGST